MRRLTGRSRTPPEKRALEDRKRSPRSAFLWFARAGWIVLTCLAIALFALGLPAKYAQLVTLSPVADANAEGALTPANTLALVHLGFTLQGAALFLVGLQVFSALVFVALGALIFWQRSADPMGLLTALYLTIFGTVSFPDTVDALVVTHPQWWWPVHLLKFCGGVCLGLFIFVFPNGRFVPRWMRYVAAIFILDLIPFNFIPADSPLNTSLLANVAFIGLLALAAIAQIYRYRRVSSPAQRQQTKWVILGVALTVLSYIGTKTLLALSQSVVAANAISPIAYYLGILILPISIAIAILRSQLWDINIVIRRTLIYGSLTTTLAVVYFGVVLGSQSLTRLVTGKMEQSSVVIVLTTLLIAALVQPLRGYFQRQIDRRFYRSKYDAARTLTVFGQRLRTEIEIEELETQLLTVVEETMQPSQISLWLRTPHQRVNGTSTGSPRKPGLSPADPGAWLTLARPDPLQRRAGLMTTPQ